MSLPVDKEEVGLRIPPEILTCKALTIIDKMVAAEMLQMQKAYGFCGVGQKHFAARLDISLRSVQLTFKKLTDLGWLTKNSSGFVLKIDAESLKTEPKRAAKSAGKSANGAQKNETGDANRAHGDANGARKDANRAQNAANGAHPSIQEKQEEQELTFSLPESGKPPRARNDYFDAVAFALCLDPKLGSNGGLIGKLAAAAKKAGYTVEEIQRFKAAYAAIHSWSPKCPQNKFLQELAIVRDPELGSYRKPEFQRTNKPKPKTVERSVGDPLPADYKPRKVGF